MIYLSHNFDEEANETAPIYPLLPENNEYLELNDSNFGGLSDIVLGFKAAILADPDQYFTFQFRAFFPTGDTTRGLGTGHYSAEPGLLYFARPTERVSVMGEFKAWIPIDGSHTFDGRQFAAPILNYGLGFGYDMIQKSKLRVTQVTEFVGWTMLGGYESVGGKNLFPNDTPDPVHPPFDLPASHGVAAVKGTTIIDAKVGVRTYFGSGDNVYVGVAQALTPDRWYNQMIRVEYCRNW